MQREKKRIKKPWETVACTLAILIGLTTLLQIGRAEEDKLELEESDPAVAELEEEVEGDTATGSNSNVPAGLGLDELTKASPELYKPEVGEDPLLEGRSSEPASLVAAPEPALLSVKNEIKSIEFKMEGPVSRIVIRGQSKLNFRVVPNTAMKQVALYFENTATPQRLQRAFDTTEFPTPVALFTLLQMPGETPALSKLIIQLRESKEPTVSNSENALFVDFGAPVQTSEPKLIIGDEDGNGAVEENIYSNSRTFRGQVIDRLELKNTDIQDVLRLIAKYSDLNIVIGEDVQGKIGTLSLVNIPWDQAFTLVLQSKKLGYIRQGNVLRVGTLASLKSEKEEALANEQSRIKVEPLRTLLIPISYAKASNLSPRAKSFLTERGTVDVDDRTNTVIVKDVEEVVTRVQKLLSVLDTQPARVSITGKIVEMTSGFVRDIGFKELSFTESLAGINLDQSVSTSAGGKSLTRISAPRLANLNAQFRLGESENKVKVLANPSVSVIANQAASISSTVSFFRPVSQATPSGVVTSFAEIRATLSLEVTPVVANDGSISMTVNVRNEIPRLGSDNNINIDTRQMQTQVLIENGDTAVIGGLFQNTVNSSREGTMFLMRVPILGFFFQGTSSSDTSTEIFVFLTAKILNAEESFKKNL